MKAKKLIRAVSVMLSALMLASTAQAGLTALAAETKAPETTQQAVQATVSPSEQPEPQPLNGAADGSAETNADAAPATEALTEAPVKASTAPTTKALSEDEAVGAAADEAVGDTGYSFSEESGTLTINGSGSMPNYGSSNSPWYAKRNLIRTVIIENGVTGIGNYSFYNCENLTSVTIPGSVTRIGSDAFANCRRLESVSIPDSVTTVESYAFYNCTALNTVKMSKNVKTLSYALFQKCTSLASFDIPDGVTTIDSNVFENTAIKTLAVPDSVTSISGNKFSGLTDVTVRANTGSYAKLYCDRNGIAFESTGVTNREGSCGDKVTYFLDSAKGVLTVKGSSDMYNYSGSNMPWNLYRDYVKTVVIENGVTSVGNSAFAGCVNLTAVTLPNSLTRIGSSAFSGCQQLNNVTVPDSVTTVESYAFYNCTALTSVKMSKNVKTLNYCLFSRCSSLASFDIPDGVTTIDSYVFEYTAIKTLAVPDSVTSIGGNKFSGLTDVTVKGNTGSYAKLYCDRNEITFESTGVTNREGSCGDKATYSLDTAKGVLTIKGSGEMYNYSGSNMPWNLYRDYVKTVVIENGVTSVGNNAFAGCEKLTAVTIPNSVTRIGSSAFSGCQQLNNVTVPDSVTTVESYAFYNCTALTSVKMSKNVKTLNYCLFSRCSSLASFDIPDGVTTIDSYVFEYTAIKTLAVPDSVTSIGGNKFSGLTDVTVKGNTGSYAKLYCDRNGIAFESTGVTNREGSCGDKASYFLDSVNGVLTIKGSGEMYNYSGSNMPWSLYRDYVKTVVIENGVTSVGNSAFAGCVNLTAVTIPNSVTRIGSSAFSDDTKLESIVIPDSVTTVENYAFYNCSALTSVKMSKNIKKLNYCLFNRCASLASFDIPDGVTTIDSYVFENTAIKTIAVPDSVTSISGNKFSGLTDVTVKGNTGSYAKLYCDRNQITFESTGVINHEGSCGDNVTYFLDSANGVLTIKGSGEMYNYSGSNMPWSLYRDYIKTIVIENGVTSVGNSAFAGCEKLTAVTIPNSMTRIGSSAFSDDIKLESIVIPDSVTTVENYAFYNCSALTSVTMSKNIKKLSYCLFNRCSSLAHFDIPNGVTTIDSYAFEYTAIKTIAVPDSVTSIGGNKFSGLTDVTVKGNTGSYAKLYCDRNEIPFESTGVTNHKGNCGDNVTYSLDSANGVLTLSGSGSTHHYNSSDMPWSLYRDYIKTIVVEDGVTAIGNYIFAGCTNLTAVTIPDGVTAIGVGVFSDCKNLLSVSVPDTVKTVENYAFSNCSALRFVKMSNRVTKLNYALFLRCSSLESFEIPGSVTQIDSYAFEGAGIKTITVPNSVTVINSYAFYNCAALESAAIADSVSRIDNGAFEGCVSLKTVNIPDQVTVYSSYLFKNCRALESIEIADGVTKISSEAFRGTGLKSVYIPNSVFNVNSGAFMDCGSLKSVRMSKQVTVYSSSLFENCKSLESIEIADGVTTIDSYAFKNAALKEITLPETLKTIGYAAFDGCFNLTDVSVPTSTTDIREYAFANCPKLVWLLIPETTVSVGRNLVRGSENVTIVGMTGSAAYDYAVSEHVRFTPVSGAGDGFAVCETGKQYVNMILRFTSTDGEKVYTKQLTASDTAALYGLDAKKTYNAEICSRNGNVFCSKKNISFGSSNSVSVSFDNAKKPLTVRVKVTGENGAATDKFTAKWFDASGSFLADGTTLSERITGETLRCEVKLANGLLQQYKAPEAASLTLSESSDNVLTIALEKIASYTLSGTVADADGNKLGGVSVNASQTLANGSTKVANTVTDSNGQYALTLSEGAYELTAGKKGYFDQTANGTMTQNKTENITLEKLTGAKIRCVFTYLQLPKSREKALDEENLVITVYNKTKYRDISDFTLQNGYLYFNYGEVSKGDSLKITAKDITGVYANAQTTTTYSGDADSVSLVMKENGVISCTLKSSPNTGNVMLLFDSEGDYLDTYYFSGLTAETGHLKDGVYKIVLMGESDPPLSADTVSALNGYGLKDYADYRYFSVEVQHGEATELKDIEIPKLDMERLIYLDADQTMLSSNTNNVAIGQYVTVKADYVVKDEYARKTRDAKIRFFVPDNLTLLTDGVTIDGLLTGDYTFMDGVLTVNVSEKSGIVRACFSNVRPADKAAVTAKMYFTLDGKERVQSIGRVNLTLGDLDFNVAEKTSQTNLSVTGTTFPGADVSVFDNGTKVAVGKANLAGTFALPFELNQPYAKSTHSIWLEVVKPTDGTVLHSQTKTVKYAQDMPVLSKILMGGNFSHTYQEYAVDFINPGVSSVSYSFNPSYPTLTFKAEFTGDVSLLSSVVIVTTDNKGKTTEIPTVYDEASHAFVGSHTYTSGTIPMSISAQYHSNYDDSAIDLDNLFGSVDLDSANAETMDAINSVLAKEPGAIWVDEAGTTFFKMTEENAECLMTINKDQTNYKAEYLLDDELVFTDVIDVRKTTSKAQAEAMMAQMGYTKEKTLSNTAKTSGMEYFSTHFNEYTDGAAILSEDGTLTITSRTYSKEFMELVKEILASTDAEYEPYQKLLSDPVGRGWGSIIWQTLTGDSSGAQKDKMHALRDQLNECLDSKYEWESDKYAARRAFDDRARTLGHKMAAQNLCGAVGLGLTIFSIATGGVGAALLFGGIAALNFISATTDTSAPGDIAWTTGMGSAAFGDPNVANGASIVTSSIGMIASKSGDKDLDAMQQMVDDCQNGKDDSGNQRLRGSLDPSGFICEAVASNRIEGVTCTIFYSPNADGSDAVVWDAAEYGQSNPLVSDANGCYEWYVPVGYWQVKYEKEGYATTYSEWLPVPPPQTEVNVAMNSLNAPEVKQIYAYQNEIDVEFTQYMNIYTMSSKAFTVTIDGETVTGTITPVNTEKSFDKNAMNYASVFRFVPETRLQKGDKVNVSVENVVNYAGNTLQAFEGQYEVVLKPESIQAAENVSIDWKNTSEITLQVDPGEAGANKTITVTSNSPVVEILTPTVTTDADGKATVTLSGKLPGEAEVSYMLTDSDCKDTTTVSVNLTVEKVASVTASIPTGSTLKKGDKVAFACATPGAEIYYTTDLSCPCVVNSESRIKYTAPIEINEYSTIIVYAVKNGMEDSKPVLFIYDVEAEATVKGDLNGDGAFTISDVTYLQQYLAEMVSVDEETASAWDFDKNGAVGISDATYLQMVLAEIIAFD